MPKSGFQCHEHKVILSMYESTQEEETTSGGIIMPSQSSNEPQRAQVIASGAESGFREGMDVLVLQAAGITFSYSGTEYCLMHKDQIIAGLR